MKGLVFMVIKGPNLDAKTSSTLTHTKYFYIGLKN